MDIMCKIRHGKNGNSTTMLHGWNHGNPFFTGERSRYRKKWYKHSFGTARYKSKWLTPTVCYNGEIISKIY